MIDNNIVSSLGAGSGIDTNGLLKQLVEIEKAAPQQRIDNKTELAETRISDFGILSSALSTLKDSASTLVDPDALFSKSASFTDSDALVPVELGTDVTPGSYSFTVSQVAQAHTLAFSGFSDTTDSVGQGTLTFSFGTWARTAGEISGAFDNSTSEQDDVTITIDSSNDTLTGLRDAINDADMGVSVSIIFDGTDYNLSIVSESGAANEIEITAVEGATTGLSSFSFVSGTTTADVQQGQNSIVSLNGISGIERSSNSINDIVDGLQLDILQETAVNETVTITVTEDKAFAEQSVRDFIDAYNAFLEVTDELFGTREEENEDGETETVQGSLANDALAKSLISQIRSVIGSQIPGLADSNFTSLTNIGIRTELDGTLSIDEDDFSSAFEDNFEDVQKLLAPYTDSSNDDISINSFGENTQAGEYTVAVSQAPARGSYAGNAYGGSVDASAQTLTFVVDIDGTTSGTITIPQQDYGSTASLAAEIQSQINNDSAISEAGESVSVSFNTDTSTFEFTSSSYGSSSNVTFSSTSANTESFLGIDDAISGTAGATVAGTIDGVSAFGSANVLLPALGEPGESLALLINEDVTLATDFTVNFSRGFAGELESLIDAFLDSEGVIATRTETLNDNLESYESEQERLDRRIGAYEQRLLNQFIAMESILNSLQTSGSFLENLINTLPFTANNNN